MNPIKFRQPMIRKGNFIQWHHWGYTKPDCFISPLDKNQGGTSYQATGCQDNTGKDGYQGDIVTDPLTKAVYAIAWVASKGRNQLVPVNLPLSHHYVRELDCLCDYEIIGNSTENPELLAEFDPDPGAPSADLELDSEPLDRFAHPGPAYAHAADVIMDAIKSDVEAGTIPDSVEDYSQLHDYVDANEYLALIFPEWDIERDTDHANAIMELVDNRIKEGELKGD